MQHLKNRRSNSSCGSYVNNSNSIISLDGSEAPSRHKKYQYADIEKKYLLSVYYNLQELESNNRSESQKNILIECRNSLKKAIGRLREYVKQIQFQNNQLVSCRGESQQQKNKEIQNIRASLEEQLKFTQSQFNKKILDLNAESGKKQQQYKEVISKFIQSMHLAQRTWTKSYTALLNKFKNVQEIIKSNMAIDVKNRQVYQKIIKFTGHLQEKQDSFQSINSSFEIEQIQKNGNMPMPSKKYPIDISSIDNLEDNIEDGMPKFEIYFIKMIYWNFFSAPNQSNVKKLMDIIKMLDCPQEIIHQPIFPVILEAMKANLEFHHEPVLQEISQNWDSSRISKDCKKNAYLNQQNYRQNAIQLLKNPPLQINEYKNRGKKLH